VSYLILPLFALVNAGVAVSMQNAEVLVSLLGLGIVLGLGIGNPVGITLFAFIAVKLGLGALPEGVSWIQIVGAGILGGIGFAMSIFVAHLALNTPELLEGAKLSILVASILSCVCGMQWLLLLKPSRGSHTVH